MAQTRQVKLPNEIDIYKQITSLDMLLDGYIENFSVYRRNTLGKLITYQCATLIKYVCLAWRIKEDRMKYLRLFEAEYTLLDYYIRKAHKPSVKLLSDDQYLECVKIQAEISKQLNCWIIDTRKIEEM